MKPLRWRLAVWWHGRRARREHDWIDCPFCPGRERIAYLQGQVVEALQIIQDLADQRLAAADAEPFPAQVVVPPRVWAALQEVRENPEAN